MTIDPLVYLVAVSLINYTLYCTQASLSSQLCEVANHLEQIISSAFGIDTSFYSMRIKIP